MDNIKVIVKRPGEDPCEEVIANTLEEFQKLVGGAIEAVTLCSDLAIICNEDGRLMDLPYNCKIFNLHFVGTVVFVGVNGDEFTDVPCGVGVLGWLIPTIYENKE